MKELLTTPVIWFLIGLGLLLLEIALPGVFVLFFGIGAWIVSICLLIVPGMSLTAQLWIFAITSVVGLLTLRRFLQNRFFSHADDSAGNLDEEFLGRTAIAETDIPAGKSGKVAFRGTIWNAISDTDLEKGQAARIVDKESITLKVTAQK